jgi:hypothetical protein
MVSKNPAPQPPSVQQTAAAQTGSNISTALAQQQLNTIDQVGPDGSTKYSQSGTYAFTDPSTGQKYTLPKLTQTTTLSPEAQALKSTGQQTSQNLANLGKSQSERLSGLLASPFDLSNDATETRINELASKRLDPMLERRQASLDTKLSNQGIKLGSTAWDRAQESNLQGENDARNQLLLTGRNQAVSEALLQRNQPLNEIIGLSTGTQIGSPSFGGTPQSSMPTTDFAGLTANNYNQQYAQWQQQQQQNNSTLGGLFGLGSAAILASDRRLKTNIVRIGTAKNGIPLYRFKYRGIDAVQYGVMSDDVRRMKPAAIVWHPDGFDRVNYDLALEAA